jgi:exopolysaccharide biosynthesis polyprenyl glycosylphosphotransferase
MRRTLAAADVVGLTLAFLCVELLFGSTGGDDAIGIWAEVGVFTLTLPIWVLAAKVFGLYDRDEERADHSTGDELARVFLLVTVGAFVIDQALVILQTADPDPVKLTSFWGVGIVAVTAARAVSRIVARRSTAYVQNTIVVGAGDVAQLIARKLLMHREYGLNLVGFVDGSPQPRRSHVSHIPVLGGLPALPRLADEYDVERVIVAFSMDPHQELLDVVRGLRDSGVQVDVVPRLFEVVGPKVDIHTVEGLPLIGLPPVRLSRSTRVLKRGFDFVGAALGVVVLAPFFVATMIAIKLESAGPAFFRQTRLGEGMREFKVFKFRTMRVDTDVAAHRDYIGTIAGADATPQSDGRFKLEQEHSTTRVGRWLRRRSLDELPQLINVLRGEMSLVGPRPCIPYELAHFAPHHFDRFLVPAGMTGFWQVSGRAYSTFGEALDMDVLYAHSASLGLDLRLLARTPLQFFRGQGTT